MTIIRFQPLNRLTFTGKLILSKYGEDDEDTNWGKNILLSYTSRENDYGNSIGQGYVTDMIYADLITTWHFRHNVFFDLVVQYKDVISEYAPLTENTLHASLGFRWNISKRDQDF